jgi:hypothetical protein
MPTAHRAALQRIHKEQQSTGDHRDCSKEARHQNAADRAHHRASQQIILDVDPPAIARHIEPFDPPGNRPVEQINRRSERAQGTAKPARDQHADDQNNRRRNQRPHPTARRNGSRQTHQWINNQKRLSRQNLLASKILCIMIRPGKRIRFMRRPWAGTGEESVDGFRCQLSNRTEAKLTC